jgi:hypothetical protein
VLAVGSQRRTIAGGDGIIVSLSSLLLLLLLLFDPSISGNLAHTVLYLQFTVTTSDLKYIARAP